MTNRTLATALALMTAFAPLAPAAAEQRPSQQRPLQQQRVTQPRPIQPSAAPRRIGTPAFVVTTPNDATYVCPFDMSREHPIIVRYLAPELPGRPMVQAVLSEDSTTFGLELLNMSTNATVTVEQDRRSGNLTEISDIGNRRDRITTRSYGAFLSRAASEPAAPESFLGTPEQMRNRVVNLCGLMVGIKAGDDGMRNDERAIAQFERRQPRENLIVEHGLRFSIMNLTYTPPVRPQTPATASNTLPPAAR